MDGAESVMILEKPSLKKPIMVLGINGWVDGGESATGSVKYLLSRLKPKQFAEIPVDHFHVFQVPGQTSLRPVIRIEDGLVTEHRFPRNQFFYWENPQAENDLILFLGTEPNLHWKEFADALLAVADRFGVSRIYLLGGVLDKVPHTREPNVFCACSSLELKVEMERHSVQFTNYEGPARFGSTLLHICQTMQRPMVSLAARVTYYPEYNMVIPRNPKAIRAVMKRLNSLLRLGLDMSDLNVECRAFEEKLGFMAGQNTEFREYVEELEKEYREIEYEEPLEMSPDEAVRIAEELLKRKKED